MNASPNDLPGGVIGYGVATLLAIDISSRMFTIDSEIVAVFGRWDVLACGYCAALPAALLIVHLIEKQPSWQKIMIALAAVIVAVLFSALTFSMTTVPEASPAMLALGRALVSLAVMTIVVMCLATRWKVPVSVLLVNTWVSGLMLLSLTVLIPAAYADAVADGLQRDLERSLDSHRVALANRQARRLGQLNPSVLIDEQPVVRVQRKLQQTVSNLNARISQPISPEASFGELGERITTLMHLDQNREALGLLQPLTDGDRFHPIALDYQGLCYQRLEKFSFSLNSYQRASEYWETQPLSQSRQSGLASAWKGIGFAARGLSRRTLEEQAYRALVQTAPTAENHLLLARCYHEHQKTQLATEHLQIAMQLNPALEKESYSIMNTMASEHFGCWQVPLR